ncbi:D-alanyl-D-alanine carboxypeptidase family protein [Bradyrhizobium sp.]|uniref:D-alanyl-D-alanine carboxypeptidase family protein n=1 Tax=Bradyrhizobium sp. TaxID=376 RepID=UPI00262F2414|nr:D-alanyl-D-alanine carboxypeptidase family protein [Bradyrhizobium sp.]
MTMNTRWPVIATLCRELAIPSLVLASIVGFGSPAIDSDAGPTLDGLASLAANAQFADKLPPIASDAFRKAPRSVTEAHAANGMPVSREPFVTPAPADPSGKLESETSPEPAVTMTSVVPKPDDVNRAADLTSKCLLGDTCIDRYLWALYKRTPKEDSVKSQEQRKMTLKKKGKRVTVTKTFTKLIDEDFSWKDPKAAQHAGMLLEDYVIGGVDRDFKWKLFQMLHAAEEAGLSPGITSAFRDDYRQSIASGLKAADNRSYHGGSLRGGYGHGLAADIVSINGATRAQRLISSELLWNWIDAHGKEFGIGRPYLDKDPPHVAPIDGKEYADHHPGMKARRVASTVKSSNGRDDRRASKHARAGRSQKMRTI